MVRPGGLDQRSPNSVVGRFSLSECGSSTEEGDGMRRTRRVLLGTAALTLGLAPAALAGPKEEAKACVRDAQAFGFKDSWGCIDLIREALGGSDFSGGSHGDGIVTNPDVTGDLEGTTEYEFGEEGPDLLTESRGGYSSRVDGDAVASLGGHDCLFVHQWFDLTYGDGATLEL